MKPANYRLLVSFSLLLLCGHVSVAQKKEPLHADWLAMDIANLERILPQLNQNEPLTVAALEKIFASPGAHQIHDWRGNDRRLGFGAQTFAFGKSGGYTTLRVTGWVFHDTIGNYTIDLSTSSDSWPMIKSVLIDKWNRNGGPEFSEYKYGFYHERQFADVLADYKKAVANELGEMQPVNVPSHLKDDYEFLISIGDSAAIGENCGYSGSTPRGKQAIDAIVKARRVDLIVNILKGYNPGGRGYAMLALFGMMRKGLKLSPDAQRAFDVVRGLDLELTTCIGCIYMNETAQQILKRWQF